jgi:hypothetical protein
VFHAGPTIQTAFIYVFFPPEERGIEEEEGYKSFQKATLEVLSSEMDQARALKRRVGFLEKSARPPSSESPLKHESASYFSIVNDAVDSDSRGDIHCALGPLFPIEIRKH